VVYLIPCLHNTSFMITDDIVTYNHSICSASTYIRAIGWDSDTTASLHRYTYSLFTSWRVWGTMRTSTSVLHSGEPVSTVSRELSWRPGDREWRVRGYVSRFLWFPRLSFPFRSFFLVLIWLFSWKFQLIQLVFPCVMVKRMIDGFVASIISVLFHLFNDYGRCLPLW